jgi:hypothetical protein
MVEVGEGELRQTRRCAGVMAGMIEMVVGKEGEEGKGR